MDRNFARALALVLKHEGLWSDHPQDKGGPTMKGVTLANFRRYVKPNATKEDLKKITDEQVATIYRRFYWDAVRGSDLPGGIDYAVFDMAVNSGPDRAIKYLQAVVGAKQDGRIGPDTLAKTRAMMRATVINSLCDKRMAFLKRLKTWPTFGKGWTSRVSGVRAEALKMAAQPDTPPPVVVEKEVQKEVVPETVETKVKKETGLWGWLTTGFGGVGAAVAWLRDSQVSDIAAFGGVAIVGLLILTFLGPRLAASIRKIREELA
ncbi:glycoside hydrolase family 108 protein [Aquamicrobium defluvii]|uniref:Lysozyme family protein n=1 Tax=Aquamicrobium defluvii TaxID=69279 RepID=A0A4V3DKV8_9HYPH|nr:glycoside hydrolase family 108 protein [Aquamicrobium defluvii]TDR36528.1 lysozyme family protein [Aquamicrobium defluvii]